MAPRNSVSSAGGGVLIIVHGHSRLIVDPRIPTTPGRSASGFHRPGRHCLQQARGAARRWASRMKAELHPTKNTAFEADFHMHMDDSVNKMFFSLVWQFLEKNNGFAM